MVQFDDNANDDDPAPFAFSAAEVMKKFAFISMPMWLAAVFFLLADVKAAPAIPLGPLQPLGPIGNGSHATEEMAKRVALLEAQLGAVRAEVEYEKKKVASLQGEFRDKVGVTAAAVDAIPAQAVVAVFAGILGALAIAGPSSYVKGFLAVVGSFIAALFVAGLTSYLFVGSLARSPFWLDNLSDILNFNGAFGEYLFFLVFFVLGIGRWVTGWECGIYEVVDEVEMGEDGQVAMKEPLLHKAGSP